jgi:uncharacterized protein YndB with AHSA1/START domain
MNMDAKIEKFGKFEDGDTLVIQRWLPGTADRLWKYITESDLRRKWLASGEMPPAAGGAFELVWRNDELSAKGDHRPEGFPEEQRMPTFVVAISPPNLLTIAWGNGTVTFELQEKDGRTLLTLTHRGLTDKGARTMIAAGWHMHLDILGAELAGQDPDSFWAGWRRLREEYAGRIAS